MAKILPFPPTPRPPQTPRPRPSRGFSFTFPVDLKELAKAPEKRPEEEGKAKP